MPKTANSKATTSRTIRLATRASKLALIQADLVKQQLETHINNINVEIYPVVTQGDKDLTSPLYAIGGKGVFIKDVERALLENKADIAIHSLKDVTTELAPGLELCSFLAPEGIKDVLVHKNKQFSLKTLPKNAVIATGSLRRKALLKYLRPDLSTIEMRGNVLSRLEKLASLDIAGTLLSEAGLIRLEINRSSLEILDHNEFVPAPGQGVIALETRIDDEFISDCAKKINNPRQALKSNTELFFLRKVGLDCRAPLGLHAVLTDADQNMSLTLFLANQTMQHFLQKTISFPTEHRHEHVAELAAEAIKWLQQHAN